MTRYGRRVAAVVAGAFALRALLLMVRGDYIVYDEGYYLLLARSLRAGHGFTLNGLPHVALSPLQPLLVAGISLTGLPDLWASRLLAAACGALLAVPVAFLARRWLDERVAVTAAAFAATAPALTSYLPFFPGERWNLYFGSEPLYLLAAMGAMAAGVRALEDGAWRWWLLLGLLTSAAYLARLEGAVLGAAIGLVLAATIVARRRWSLVPRAALAVAVGLGSVSPYLLYLHGALGRWAVSGRVQAAIAETAAAGTGGSGRSDAVRAFVWGGDRDALWRTLYALDAGGGRMSSQYWGVPRRHAAEPGTASAARAPTVPADSAGSREERRPPEPTAGPGRGNEPAAGGAREIPRALLAIGPWWFLALAVAGALWGGVPRPALAWSLPALAATLGPAALAYAEPRALLLLVPVACVFAARAVVRIGEVAAGNPDFARSPAVAALAVTVLLLVPTARDLARAWGQQLPLQRAAAARRAVGERLASRLGPESVVVSWHPALALFARREWRVLPYDSFERIVGYARVQGADAIVFSTFEPSPLRDAPRAFTVVLLEGRAAPAGAGIRLDPIEQTPLLFIGRLAGATP